MNSRDRFDVWVKRKLKKFDEYKKKDWPITGVIRDIGPLDKLKFYYVWQVAWVAGRKALLKEIEDEKNRKPVPMPEEEMKKLWINCGLGKNFGREVEKWHGIK